MSGLYNYKWQTRSKAFLRRPGNSLCRMCTDERRVTQADVVDHIIPHNNDYDLFWDETNWQPLCYMHHNKDKQQIERRGYATSIGVNGWPLDPHHPVNKGR